MRNLARALTVAVVMVVAIMATGEGREAIGSAFGCLQTARTLPSGGAELSGFVGVADDISVGGRLTFGLAKYLDGSARLGLRDPDNGDANLTLGLDMRYQMWAVDDVVPKDVDMSIGGFFEYADFDGGSASQLGVQIQVSRAFALKSGRALTPYGRFNTRVEMVDWPGGDYDKIRFGLNAGGALELSKYMNVYLELQFDGNTGLFAGLGYDIL